VKKKSLALEFNEAAPKKGSKSASAKRAAKKAVPPRADDETDDDELPYDDMDEEVIDSQSDNDQYDDDDDRWSMPTYKPKKAFPTACVLVSVSDPDNIRVFTTASKAQNYLKLRNKSIYYQVCNRLTSLLRVFEDSLCPDPGSPKRNFAQRVVHLRRY